MPLRTPAARRISCSLHYPDIGPYASIVSVVLWEKQTVIEKEWNGNGRDFVKSR